MNVNAATGLVGSELISFWICFVLFVGGMLGISWYCRRFMRGVSDFLSANRMARKYLLTVAMGMTGGTGLIATWQMYYSSGCTPSFWELLQVPTGLVVAVTGFIIYRFRETRSLTLGQFFEMRYGRAFRNYAGWISWISGIINFGIFPAVVADMLQRILNLPEVFHMSLFGHPLNIKVTVAIMAFNMICATLIACWGGQVSIMLSDFYQEIFCKILFCLMILLLVKQFMWPDLFAGLAAPTSNGLSMVDPFKSGKADFNIWYFLIGVFGNIYNAKSWQGAAAYNTSAKTPHDAQMAGVLSRWRHFGLMATYMVPALVAYAVMHNSEAFAPIIEKVKATAASTNLELATAGGDMITAAFLKTVMPGWVWGAFAAMFFACTISSDDTSLHSWAGILVQDIVLPRCKKAPSTKTHLLWLRLAIIGIAIFAFLWSVFFPVPKLLYMYFAITGAIYLGGAGIVIFGGLYLKWGTKTGAFVSLTVGAILALAGTLVGEPTFWVKLVPHLHRFLPESFLVANAEKFPLNGQMLYFIAMMAAVACYIIFSLLTYRKPFNLDKMLHRGEYQVEGEEKTASTKGSWKEKIGFSKEFNRSDAFLFWFTICYCMMTFVVFLAAVICHFFWEIPMVVWKWYWGIYLALQVIIMAIATVWLTIGGLCNAYLLPQDLREHMSAADDDGSVISDVDIMDADADAKA